MPAPRGKKAVVYFPEWEYLMLEDIAFRLDWSLSSLIRWCTLKMAKELDELVMLKEKYARPARP